MRRSLPLPVRRPSRRGAPAPETAGTARAAGGDGRLCRAPFTSMYLDQHGDVRACCMNDTFPLGNVTEAPLLDIWRGAVATRLRRAIDAGDLGLGCGFCAPAVEDGRPDLAYARWFEGFAVDGDDPPWPRQLELSITNTCNLRCVMCNGEWSSSIRSQVEGRPPLPAVYDDGFFEQLVPFLPHLERVKLYGGEPFLASETLRVMELLVEQGLTTRCHLTTNGTQWTPRVERILSMLPVDVAVSLDAATAGTYESIRRGSSWEVVRANLDRFCEWGRRRGTWVSTTFCLMTVNWHELADFFLLADALEIDGTVNVVMAPADLSLHHLGAAELAAVVAALEERDREVAPALGQNRPMWDDALAGLRAHLVALRGPEIRRLAYALAARAVTEQWRLGELSAVGAEHVAARAEARQACERYLRPEAARVDLDPDGVVHHVDDRGVLGIPPAALLGRHHRDIRAVVDAHLGGVARVEQRVILEGVELSEVHLADGRVVHVLATPYLADPPGEADGSSLFFSVAPGTDGP